MTDVSLWFEEHEAELFHLADEAGVSPEMARTVASLVLGGADDELVVDHLRGSLVTLDGQDDLLAGVPWLLDHVRRLTPSA